MTSSWTHFRTSWRHGIPCGRLGEQWKCKLRIGEEVKFCMGLDVLRLEGLGKSTAGVVALGA
jgi:hypothetical protein